MPIEIKVTDPAKCDKGDLRLVANLLLQLVGDKPANLGTLEITVDASKAVSAVRQAVEQIAADDTPDAGEEVPSPAEVFAGGANPAVIFGGTHGSAALDADAAKINALYGQGAAGPTIGDALGNAPAAPLPTASEPVNAAAPAQSINPAPVLSGVELDSAGLPWDGRIHAESRAKIKKDNTWKKRRGVDDATVADVEAQLRAILAAPSVPNAPPAGNTLAQPAGFVTSSATSGPASLGEVAQQAASTVPPPPPAAVSPVATAPAAQVAAIPAPPPVAPELGNVPPPPPANGAPAAHPVTPVAPAISPPTGTPAETAPAPSISFAQLLPKVTLALAQKTLSDERVKQILEHYKLPSIPSLAMRKDLVQPVHDALFGVA